MTSLDANPAPYNYWSDCYDSDRAYVKHAADRLLRGAGCCSLTPAAATEWLESEEGVCAVGAKRIFFRALELDFLALDHGRVIPGKH
jgi:hypothetical protein